MVTIAQGKFSKPRPPRPEEPVRPVRKRVAADPIEKAEADIARFMTQDTKSPASSPVTDETIVLAQADPIFPTEVTPVISQAEDPTIWIPQIEQDVPAADMDPTIFIPKIDMDATQSVSKMTADPTILIPRIEQEVPVTDTDPTIVIPKTDVDSAQSLPTVSEGATVRIPNPQKRATGPIPPVQPKAPAPQPVQRRTPPKPPAEEIEAEEEPTFLERNRKPILVGCCAAILLLVVAIIAMVVSLKNVEEDDGRILNNVIVAGVNLGGMTPEQAQSAVENAVGNSYTANAMEVKLPDAVLTFLPEDTRIALNVEAAVQAAFNYGRVGTAEEIKRAEAQSLVGQYEVDLMPYLQMDAAYIHDTLEEYGEAFSSSYSATSYTLEGTRPGLTADTFNASAPCQVLVIRIGTPGRNLDVENIYTAVLEAYCNRNFSVDASQVPEEEPEMPDLDAIFAEYCSTPVDAYMDMETFAVTGEVYGYTFDLDAAREKVANSDYGDTLRIPMEYMIPEICTADLASSLYADVLGMAQTEHTGNADRNTNIRLACQAINGTILQPGDEFSFNDVVGERTSARGYRKAPAYSSGETVSELGGGICQVSSTLYYSVLLAELDVTARQNHSYVSSYIPMGMDATVSWGGPEFKFRNNTSYPIRIEAEISGGYVTVRLMGTDTRDYYVKMEYDVAGYLQPETEYKEFEYDNEEGYKDGDVIQEGSTGYVVDTYKKKIDKETGEEIGDEFVARSSYRPHNEIIAKVAPPPTTEPPTEEPTEAPTEAPTEKPTEKPTEAPTEKPTEKPTEAPTEKPTEKPTEAPTEAPTEKPTEKPTEAPTERPTEKATEAPTEKPTEKPTEAPTEKPTEKATEAPTEKPTEEPTPQTEAPAETEAPAA